MQRLIRKLVPVILFWGIFIFVVLQVPYPKSLIQIQIIQLMSFFIPLILALIFTINLFVRNFYLSCSLSLGLVSLLILKALDTLNLVTSALIIVTVGLLISYFRKIKRGSLTKLPKIPKLTRLRKKI